MVGDRTAPDRGPAANEENMPMTAVNHAPLRKVTLHAARSKAFPEGSIRHGYDFVAPLTEEGRIDLGAWRDHRGECFAHRFWAGEPTMQGLLVHRAGGRGGSTWAFEWKSPQVAANDEDEASASATTQSKSASTCRSARPRASF